MTLGEKIKYYRTNKGLSQEKLAECLNVSRQAITKWERDGGVPELNNLIALSEVFGISIDTLIEKESRDNENRESRDNENRESGDSINQMSIMPEYYDVELSGWNDGESNVLLVNEDDDFLYFVKSEKNNVFGVAIKKKYIANVTRLNKSVPSDFAIEQIDKTYFNGKVVNIELAKKDGIIAGFLDFRDDDYQSCKIENIDKTHVFLELGRSLKIDEITKIVEA